MMRELFNLIGLSRSTFSSNFTPILAILALSIFTITPKFFYNTYIMLWWIVFFLYEVHTYNISNRKLGNLLLLGIIFVLDCALYKFIGVSSASMGYCVSAPFLYFAPVLALITIDKCDNKQQIRFLFHFLSLAVAINIADNIRLSYEFGMENVVFQRLGGMVEEEGNSEFNFGGSQFVNMTVFYTCIMFMAYLKSNERLEKILFGVYVAISAYFIVICSLKASAVVLMLMSLALMYVSVKSKANINTVLILLTVLGVIAFIFMDNVIHLLISVIDSDRITERLIIFTNEGDVTDSSSFVSRSNLWSVSIDTWLSSISSFFFGIGNHNWNDFMTTADSGIGNHSDILDVLARYGIIGALILYLSFKLYYDYLRYNFGTSYEYEIFVFFILFLAMGLTKKVIHPLPAIMIFILFPITLKYFSNKES